MAGVSKLRARRVELGLSQWELSLACNVPRWAIQLIENGYRAPTVEEVSALSQALCVSPEAMGWEQ
jgi:predicted transcriptional regulator